MFYGEEGVDAGGVRKVTCPVFILEIRFRGYIKDWAPDKFYEAMRKILPAWFDNARNGFLKTKFRLKRFCPSAENLDETAEITVKLTVVSLIYRVVTLRSEFSINLFYYFSIEGR